MPAPGFGAPQTLRVASTAFAHGSPIPPKFTCQGSETSPPLAFAGVPRDAAALAMVMDDPDAPRRTFTHWTWWDAPATTSGIPEGTAATKVDAKEGRNDAGEDGYVGPCPPSGTHRYFFRLYALRAPLGLPSGASPADVHAALEGKVLAWGELLGTYAKG